MEYRCYDTIDKGVLLKDGAEHWQLSALDLNPNTPYWYDTQDCDECDDHIKPSWKWFAETWKGCPNHNNEIVGFEFMLVSKPVYDPTKPFSSGKKYILKLFLHVWQPRRKDGMVLTIDLVEEDDMRDIKRFLSRSKRRFNRFDNL